MLKELIKVANKLDSVGLSKEADVIDGLIKKIATTEGLLHYAPVTEEEYKWGPYAKPQGRLELDMSKMMYRGPRNDYMPLWDFCRKLMSLDPKEFPDANGLAEYYGRRLEGRQSKYDINVKFELSPQEDAVKLYAAYPHIRDGSEPRQWLGDIDIEIARAIGINV